MKSHHIPLKLVIIKYFKLWKSSYFHQNTQEDKIKLMERIAKFLQIITNTHKLGNTEPKEIHV